MINIDLPLIQLPFNTTHFNIYSTSTIHHLHADKLPSEQVSWQLTYLHPFVNKKTSCHCTEIPKLHIPSLSISSLNLLVQKLSFTAHAIIRTNVIARIFTFSFQDGSHQNPLQQSLTFPNLIFLSLLVFRTSTKRHQTTSRKPRSKTYPYSTHHLQYLSFWIYSYKYWTNIVKSSRSWTTSLCTYLGLLSYLIWFTLIQN